MAFLRTRSSTVILITTFSVQGQSKTMVGYSSVLTKIDEAIQFKSDSWYLSQQ